MEVGLVVESRTPLVQEGETVAMAYGHKTGHTANAIHEVYVRYPDDLDPILGIYVAQMGPICANALLHAAADLMGRNVYDIGDGVRGRNIVVIGAGVVGLLTGLFARWAGAAEVLIANRTTPRLKIAQSLGLTPVNESETNVARHCKERWHHGTRDRGADVVFQCRGESASLQLALECLRPQGTVIDMAFYQSGASDLFLGREFHHNGLTIRCAQIARVPAPLADTWSRQRLAQETIELLRDNGDLIAEHLITHCVPFNTGDRFLTEMALRYHPEIVQAVLRVEDEDDYQLTV
jgi:threonine dehydrogenase-like Zn-dependent dehydrogenase